MPMGGNMIAIKGILLNSFVIRPVYPQTIKRANEWKSWVFKA